MFKKTSLFILILLSSFCLLHSPLPGMVRAAVDVGSGKVRVVVADVYTRRSTLTQILYDQEYPLPLQKDMQVRGANSFSPEVQQLALDTLRKFKEEVAPFEPKEWAGIATAASRVAQNAPEFYQKVHATLGIPIHIISQDEEGRLGFLTALSAGKIVQPAFLVSLDVGGGSFQLATETAGSCIEVVKGDMGYTTALSTLITEMRGQKLDLHSSPNPVTESEAEELVEKLQNRLPPLPPYFAKKFHKPTTQFVGIGLPFYAALGTGKTTFTKEELWEAIIAHCDLSDAQLLQKFTHKEANPKAALVAMVQIYAIMDGLDIPTLTFAPSKGNCEGLLTDHKGGYWKLYDPNSGGIVFGYKS